MWSIIQLRDRDFTLINEEDDFKDGLILDRYNTKKEALEEVNQRKFIQNLALGFGIENKKYRWIVVREEEV